MDIELVQALQASGYRLAVQTKALCKEVLAVQQAIGADGQLSDFDKQEALIDLNRIFVALEAMKMKIAGHDDKEDGISDHIRLAMADVSVSLQGPQPDETAKGDE